MSDLLKRVLFAVPAGAGFVAITWLGSYYLAVLLVVLLLIGQYEVSNLAAEASLPTNKGMLYVLGLWIFSVFMYPPVLWVGLLLIGGLVSMEIFLVKNESVDRLSHTIFWGLYGPMGFGAFLWIRGLGNNMEGFALALALLLMVWFNDILAYLGGRFIGKRPMAPDISPNKTWEGFIFGLAGAILGLVISMYIMSEAFPLTIYVALPMALLSSITGPLGDLTQSRLKRVANMKDASNIFPGHGGVWDRFDAMILTSIVLTGYIELLNELAIVSF